MTPSDDMPYDTPDTTTPQETETIRATQTRERENRQEASQAKDRKERQMLQPACVDELPKTAQRAGIAKPADYRPAPRLVSRIATEPLRLSTIEIIKAPKARSPHHAHAVLLHAIIATTAAATIVVIAAASGKSRIRPVAIRPNEPPPPRPRPLTDDEKMS